jgi:hypothetical protein
MYSQLVKVYNRSRQQDRTENSMEFINTDSEDYEEEEEYKILRWKEDLETD